MPISTDTQAVLLLCSHLGLPSEPDPSPLTLREWNPVTRQLQAASLRPGDLLAMGAMDLQTQLVLTEAEASRLARLLERSGALAIELERLESVGIHVLTRADVDYPFFFQAQDGIRDDLVTGVQTCALPI